MRHTLITENFKTLLPPPLFLKEKEILYKINSTKLKKKKNLKNSNSKKQKMFRH